MFGFFCMGVDGVWLVLVFGVRMVCDDLADFVDYFLGVVC